LRGLCVCRPPPAAPRGAATSPASGRGEPSAGLALWSNHIPRKPRLIDVLIQISNSREDEQPRSRGAIAPEFCERARPRNEKRAQGMPGEGLTHGPPATKKAGGSYHRFSQIIRHSLRDGVTAYNVLSPGPGLSCPRHQRDHLASLTPASGCQDHTISPSATTSFVRRCIASIASRALRS
jgi:hypothetical protein